MSAPELADRIRRLEDRAEITELAVRYCLAIDDSDYAGMVDMYTEKATLGDDRRPPGGRRHPAVDPQPLRPHDPHSRGAHDQP